MAQPREREVPCQLCRRKTANVSAVCDNCSPHPGSCEQCGQWADKRVVMRVPLDEWNFDEQRWCEDCESMHLNGVAA